MKHDVIWWWCAGCGHVWGQPQRFQGSKTSDWTRSTRATCVWGDVALVGPTSLTARRKRCKS